MINVWPFPGGRPIAFSGYPFWEVYGLALSPDGRFLAGVACPEKDQVPDQALTCVDSQVWVWDLTEVGWYESTIAPDAQVLQRETGSLGEVAFSPYGARIAAGEEDGTIRVWDAGTGEELLTIQEHRRPVDLVTFTRDGALLVTAGQQDGDIRFWDARTGEMVRAYWSTLPGRLNALVFSPAGNLFALARGTQVQFWRAEDGAWRVVKRMSGGQAEVLAVAFSPDGTLLVTAGQDGVIRLWAVSP
jgi:WD40 repeat protein